MKQLLIAACLCTGFLLGEEIPSAEAGQVHSLLVATQERVGQLQSLEQSLDVYKAAEAGCLKSPNDKALLHAMAQAGKRAYDLIDEMGLHDYFRADFVKELKTVSAIADKKAIPPAR